MRYEGGGIRRLRGWRGLIAGLLRDRRGQFGPLFALSAVALLTAVGSGLDLGRAYIERQELSSAAALTCQYAGRPSVTELTYGANPSAYSTQVNTYLTNTLAAQKLAATQTVVTPFSYSGAAATISLAANVPTTLMNLVGIRGVPVSTSIHCAAVPQPPPASNQQTLVSEGFENAPCTNPQNCITWHMPNGSSTAYEQGTAITPTSTPPSGVGYVGVTGTQWYITGYCLEIDGVQTVTGTVPEGSYSAELDCDNGSDSAGNSSISTRVYLQANQQYELRYFYKGRLADDTYSPTYICGSAASDTSWANDANYYLAYNQGQTYTAAQSSSRFGARTDQINVYLDPETSAGTFPLHTTLDGTQQLGGSNLIDECLYAANWTERSVIITPGTAGYYWLSFAADGASDSYGGLLDYIQLCQGTCAGSVQDNFPSAWSSVNNGGNYKTLFEDTFESPTYTATQGVINSNGNLNNSLGTSGTSSSGWPGQASFGWTTAPTNKSMYVLAAADQGSQSISLDDIGATTGYASRQFLLVPGYYKVTYDYVADAIFTALGTSVYCGATPSAANISALSGNSATATWRTNGGTQGTFTEDTNTVGVFVSHTQLVSVPVAGGALGSTTSFVNPDGSTSTTPTAAPNAISLTSYNASQNNALLDICGYASTWQTRTAYFRIVKPAYYLLTFAALGSADGYGGSIDDVKLTGLDGPYMSGAPASFVTIPVPSPQPNATISYTGFSFPAEGQYD